ncbi:MAG TPA: hypothetical protein VFM12_06390 [Gemmatimonadales bacterium]|nr:hypothetical protein [Gemmatimonadales bacterium]
MSIYADDPRVRREGAHHFVVTVTDRGDEYEQWVFLTPGQGWNNGDRGFAGYHATADEAIATLIGDPQVGELP